jgi:hypothetical protein
MQTNEINPEGPELLQSIHQLAQAPRKAVVAVHHHAIDRSLPAIGDELIERGTMFFGPTDALVHIFGDNLPVASRGFLSGADLGDVSFRNLFRLSEHVGLPRLGARGAAEAVDSFRLRKIAKHGRSAFGTRIPARK